MGTETCPAGMKKVQGATIKYPAQIHPNLAETTSVPNLCVDTKAVTNTQYDNFVREKYPKGFEKSPKPIVHRKANVPAKGVDIDIAKEYCKALGKRLPKPTEAQHIIQSGKISFLNRLLEGFFYTWMTYWNGPRQHRVVSRIRKPNQLKLYWLPSKLETRKGGDSYVNEFYNLPPELDFRGSHASFFCVAKPKKK